MQAVLSKTRFSFDPLALCLSLMDGSWLYIFAWLFSRVVLNKLAFIGVPHPILLGLVEYAAVVLTIYLIRRGVSDVVLRIALGLSGLWLAGAVALAYTPLNIVDFKITFFVPFFFIILLTLGIWALGSTRGATADSYERAYLHFRLGLIVIVVSTLLSTVVLGRSIDSLWASLWGIVLFFFGIGLAALALGNRDTVRRESTDSGLRSWGGMLGGSVGVVLLLGVVAQAFGAGDIVTIVKNVVLVVLEAIAGVLYVITVIIVWPFTFCNIGLPNPANVTPVPARTPTGDPMEPLQKFQRENGGYNPINIPIEWQALFIGLAALLVIAAFLYFLFRWLSVGRTSRREQFDEEHERFGSWALLWGQIRAWVQRLLSRFHKTAEKTTSAEEDELASLRGRADMAGTLTIRQIYARLLSNARKAGYPRAPQQTPSEYLRVLSNALPNMQPDLEAITSAYLEARYSPYPASTMSVNSANEAWRRIEASGIGQTA